MGILVNKDTRLVVQGITGREGSFHALNNKRYGTNVVAGVTRLTTQFVNSRQILQ